MTNEESKGIVDDIMEKALGNANWAADLFVMQKSFENALLEHMKRPTMQKELEKND